MRLSTPIRRLHRSDGFTLVEIMVASAIGAAIMGAVLTTYIFVVKGFQTAANYSEVHAAGRLSVDYFAKDVRSVYTVTSCTSTSLVVGIPTAFNSVGSVISNKTVTYSYSNGALNRTDSSTGFTDMMATNIYQLTFSLYDHLGSNTAVLASAKGVQLDIKLRKYVQSKIQSEDYLSARIDMRNVP